MTLCMIYPKVPISWTLTDDVVLPNQSKSLCMIVSLIRHGPSREAVDKSPLRPRLATPLIFNSDLYDDYEKYGFE